MNNFLKLLILMLLATTYYGCVVAQEPATPYGTPSGASVFDGKLYINGLFYPPIFADTPAVGSLYRPKRNGAQILRQNGSDTTLYMFKGNRWIPLSNQQTQITLTTGGSGAATFINGILNIPVSGGGGTEFFNANKTATDDRSHDMAQHFLFIGNADHMTFRSDNVLNTNPGSIFNGQASAGLNSYKYFNSGTESYNSQVWSHDSVMDLSAHKTGSDYLMRMIPSGITITKDADPLVNVKFKMHTDSVAANQNNLAFFSNDQLVRGRLTVTLQGVTNDGNTTTNPIIATNLIRAKWTSGNPMAYINSDATTGFLGIMNTGGFQGSLSATNLTGSRVFEMPNHNGTYALSVNGTFADNAGNIVISTDVGSASTLTTPRNIFGYPFNGGSDVTGKIDTLYLNRMVVDTASAQFLKNKDFTHGTNTWPLFNQSTTGNAATVTNGIYSNLSYNDPSWLTGLSFGKITSQPTTLVGYGITDAQPLDGDLTTIASLTATTNNFMLATGGAWSSRNPGQAKAALGITTSDIASFSTDVNTAIGNYATANPLYLDSVGGSYTFKTPKYTAPAGVPHFRFIPWVFDATQFTVVHSAGGDSNLVSLSGGGGSGGTTTNALTLGAGLSGTSFNGSAAITANNLVFTGITSGDASWYGVGNVAAVQTVGSEAGNLHIYANNNATKGRIYLGVGGAYFYADGASNNSLTGINYIATGQVQVGSSSATSQVSYRRTNAGSSTTPAFWVGTNSVTAASTSWFIDQTNKLIGLNISNGTNRVMGAAIQGVVGSTTAGSESSGLQLMGQTAGATSRPIISANSDGTVDFNEYGAGTKTGTLAYTLGVSSTGDVIETTAGSGHKRTFTYTSNGSPAINTDNYDMVSFTALTTDIAGFTMTGTPTIGDEFWVMIKGTASRAITWGASFGASTITLPTTTSGTNRLFVKFMWDGSLWTIIGQA